MTRRTSAPAWLRATFILLWLAGIYGYVANLVKFIMLSRADEALALEIILRALGICFPPFGAIYGYF